MKEFNLHRYQRQILLDKFDEKTQIKLLSSKILVCGAGGLGSPALLYLAAAGVGTIGIVDFDIVDLSNLQRQIIYNNNDIGKPKAKTAVKKLKELNPEIYVIEHAEALTNQNALDIISQYDLVLDGTDNFETRYLINDACVLLDKPLIYGAVLKFEGQVGVFNFKSKETEYTTNYRDLFPTPPDPKFTTSCNEAGVLGVLPGVIGTMQATEAIKLISGIGVPMANQILTYNALENSFYKLKIKPNQYSNNNMPLSKEQFLKFDYNWFCNSTKSNDEIDIYDLKNLIKSEKLTIIDIREEGEKPDTNDFEYLKMPMSRIYEYLIDFKTTNKIILFCQTGKRSLYLTEILKEEMPENTIYSLKGGIVDWVKHN